MLWAGTETTAKAAVAAEGTGNKGHSCGSGDSGNGIARQQQHWWGQATSAEIQAAAGAENSQPKGGSDSGGNEGPDSPGGGGGGGGSDGDGGDDGDGSDGGSNYGSSGSGSGDCGGGSGYGGG